MTPPNEKGVELEVAVHTIETYILASSPALREKSFTIQSRKPGRSSCSNRQLL